MEASVTAGPFTALTDALERAARNGTRAHLPPEIVRALVSSEAYSLLSGYRIKELQQLWQESDAQPAPPAAPSSDRSGSGTGPIATIGRSAGTMTETQFEAVGHAASQRALEAVHRISRRRRLKIPSSGIMKAGAAP